MTGSIYCMQCLRGALSLAVTTLAMVFLTAFAAGAQESLGKHDSTKPIEISADSLEVQREQGIAIFSGKVDAVQGTMRLRADRLTVHYRPNGKKGQDGAMAQGAISRMDADGNVFLSSPSETAQGKKGVYDVDRRVVTLTGSVLLTRGENVVRGDRLVMNLDTGVSRVESARVPTPGGKPKQRVKGIFVPQKKN
jgi:lipopolysaccharide export system protein LptA